MLAKVGAALPSFEDASTLHDELNNYLSVTKDVYMEIGLQCGAALTAQLLAAHPLQAE